MFQKKKVGADKQDVRKTVWEAEELSATVQKVPWGLLFRALMWTLKTLTQRISAFIKTRMHLEAAQANLHQVKAEHR